MATSMTPTRAKRNSRAPERFSSEEAKLDTASNGPDLRFGDKTASKSAKPIVREPLKVKLPKLKRFAQSAPQQIKVRISRVNGSNKNNGAKLTSKIKLPAYKPHHHPDRNSNDDEDDQHAGPRVALKGTELGTSLLSSCKHNKSDLKNRTNPPSVMNSPKRSPSMPLRDLAKPSEAKGQATDKCLNESVATSDDHELSRSLDEADSSCFSSDTNSEKSTSAMQIVVGRKPEPNNSGIRCPCGVEDDLGVMVECEKCSTWQHGHCINVGTEDDAYEGYVCGYCALPEGKHTDSLRQLTVGDRFQSKFEILESLIRKRANGISLDKRHETADENQISFSPSEFEQAILDLKRVFNSLRVKWSILTNDDYHAELKIWRNHIWSDDEGENLKQQQRQVVSFVGDIYKGNLRLHILYLLPLISRRCQLIRYQLSVNNNDSKDINSHLMILDEISQVVENYSEFLKK